MRESTDLGFNLVVVLGKNNNAETRLWKTRVSSTIGSIPYFPRILNQGRVLLILQKLFCSKPQFWPTYSRLRIVKCLIGKYIVLRKIYSSFRGTRFVSRSLPVLHRLLNFTLTGYGTFSSPPAHPTHTVVPPLTT